MVVTPNRASVPSRSVRVPPYSWADGDDVVAGLAQRADDEELGRLTAGGRHRADSAFEAGHSLLERGDGRVADAGVDVAELLQREEVGSVGGVLEHEAGRLEDRHRPSTGDRFGVGAGMDRPGAKPPLAFALSSRDRSSCDMCSILAWLRRRWV